MAKTSHKPTANLATATLSAAPESDTVQTAAVEHIADDTGAVEDETSTTEDVAGAESLEDSTALSSGTVEITDMYAPLLAVCKKTDPKFAEPHAKESVQSFLKRFVRTVTDAHADDWEALPEAVQIYYNAMADQLMAGAPITIPTGFPTDVVTAPEKVNATKLTGKAALEAANKLREEKKKVKQAEREAKAIAEGKPLKVKADKGNRPIGVVTFMRMQMIKNPLLTKGELEVLCANAGHPISDATITSVRGTTMSTLDAITALGYKLVPPEAAPAA